MTKTFCDRCKKEMTFEGYFNFIQCYRDLNRKELGLKSIADSEQPKRKILCEECYEAVNTFLLEGRR